MYVGLRPDSRFVPGQLGMGLVEGTVVSDTLSLSLWVSLFGLFS